MTARMARNNSDVPIGPDWNGNPIPPGGIAIIDDEDATLADDVAAGALELDPTVGRHYTAGPTERKVRPTP